MEQRRFFEVRGEESGEWLVLDAKRHPPRVICRCLGWNAPKNTALIVAALEAHNSEFYSKFALDGPGRLNEQRYATRRFRWNRHGASDFEALRSTMSAIGTKQTCSMR
jgi:hypothetical protein